MSVFSDRPALASQNLFFQFIRLDRVQSGNKFANDYSPALVLLQDTAGRMSFSAVDGQDTFRPISLILLLKMFGIRNDMAGRLIRDFRLVLAGVS